jgi:ubiquinol-cytochrome c reductase cytochrome b subunit
VAGNGAKASAVIDMRHRIRAAVSWIESRTGLESAVRNFLIDDVPASAGWPQVFGSVALFLFLIQVFTGILLSFNYAGTPGEAYNSVFYIVRELTAGRMIRALHHWGASMMLIAVVIHMVQVFVYGAYKKPREATWIAGVLLLLLTLGFGLTGYLLPWDNRAYWGTVVTTKIMGQAPIVGEYLQQLLGAQNGVGVITFSRFYSLHALLLPVATMLLIGVHIILVRRHGVTPAAFDSRPARKFYPEQAFRDVIAIFAAFVLLFAAALLLKVPLERLADPTDASYVPRPEWYFLFLFQSLKFFQGSLEPIGSVVLPNVAVLALICVPFIDRGRVRSIRERTVAIALVLVAFSGWTALTAAAMRSTPGAGGRPATAAAAPSPAEFSAEETAGLGYFRQERCEICHNLVDGEPKPGPNLAGEGRRRSADWMIQHFKNPSEMVPGSNMPPIQLNVVELNALSAFLLKLTPENSRDLGSMQASDVEGAQVFVAGLCSSCHKVNGTGGEIGPPLNGVGRRRSSEWMARHFDSPQEMSPGTVMPPYHFTPTQEKAIISYLSALP